jgi:hypothetical protein
MHITKFPHEVTTELACYVYRLIDPRNGETFYVGKGSGDRIFHHCIADAKYLEGSEFGNKLKRIREIRALGLDVGHIIHRHGMDDATASEVEAALIDAYVGLTNLVAGAQSDTRGSMHVTEIINRYSAETAEFGHDLTGCGNTAMKKRLFPRPERQMSCFLHCEISGANTTVFGATRIVFALYRAYFASTGGLVLMSAGAQGCMRPCSEQTFGQPS